MNEESSRQLDAIIRNGIADYLWAPVTGTDVPYFAFMGAGFRSLDESPNAQSESRPYISDASATSILRGYETQFPFAADLIASEDAINFIYSIGRNQKTSSDAQTQYIRTELFLPTGTPNVHPARLFTVSIEVSTLSGEGTNIQEMDGNFNNVGSFIPGVFNTETLEFTPMSQWSGPKLYDNLFLESDVSVGELAAYVGKHPTTAEALSKLERVAKPKDKPVPTPVS